MFLLLSAKVGAGDIAAGADDTKAEDDDKEAGAGDTEAKDDGKEGILFVAVK